LDNKGLSNNLTPLLLGDVLNFFLIALCLVVTDTSSTPVI